MISGGAWWSSSRLRMTALNEIVKYDVMPISCQKFRGGQTNSCRDIEVSLLPQERISLSYDV